MQYKVTAGNGGGETVTIVVRVERGWIFLSLEPRFMGQALLDAEKAQAVIRALGMARDRVRKPWE